MLAIAQVCGQMDQDEFEGWLAAQNGIKDSTGFIMAIRVESTKSVIAYYSRESIKGSLVGGQYLVNIQQSSS